MKNRYARIMYNRYGERRRCIVVMAKNENEAAEMLDRLEQCNDVDFDYREWYMKSGEVIPDDVELA